MSWSERAIGMVGELHPDVSALEVMLLDAWTIANVLLGVHV